MLCRKPYMLGALPCPCGGCLPCRINRRRVWAHRILLESFKHGDNCFVTLTYSEDNVPTSLVKSDYQNWLKRLRKVLSPKTIRYFVSGEYGELSHRPHFHAAIFGLDRLTAGGVDGRAGLVADTWTHGFTFVGDLTFESASYIAGYLTKKVVSDVDRGVKEFSRMSLRPGIGSWAMGDVARSLSQEAGLDSLISNGDVPSVLKHGKRLLPLGRYLRRQLRGEMGFASKDTPSEASRLYALRHADEASALRSQFSTKEVLDIRKQKILNMEARFKIRDPKRSL